MIVVTIARKPVEGSTTRNAYKYGTGSLNIEDTRLGWVGGAPSQDEWNRMGSSGKVGANGFAGQISVGMKQAYADGLMPIPSGRWPANLILEHRPGCQGQCLPDCPVQELDRQGGVLQTRSNVGTSQALGGSGASRFFKLIGGRS